MKHIRLLNLKFEDAYFGAGRQCFGVSFALYILYIENSRGNRFCLLTKKPKRDILSIVKAMTGRSKFPRCVQRAVGWCKTVARSYRSSPRAAT